MPGLPGFSQPPTQAQLQAHLQNQQLQFQGQPYGAMLGQAQGQGQATQQFQSLLNLQAQQQQREQHAAMLRDQALQQQQLMQQREQALRQQQKLAMQQPAQPAISPQQREWEKFLQQFVEQFHPQTLSPEEQRQYASLPLQAQANFKFELAKRHFLAMQFQRYFAQLSPLQQKQYQSLTQQQQQHVLQFTVDQFDAHYDLFLAASAKQEEEARRQREELARRQDEEARTMQVHSRYSYGSAEAERRDALRRKKPPLNIPLVNRVKLEERMREARMRLMSLFVSCLF
jgi:hypothetical protein